MGDSSGGRDLQKTLFNRHDVLAALAERPRTKPELVADVGSSRSTIDRAVAELEREGCIERLGSEYHPTLLGRVVLSEYRDYETVIDDASEARSLLDRLPNEVPMSSGFLRGVTVQTANPNAPESALEPALDRLQHADRLATLTPVTLSLYVTLVETYVGEHDLEVEIVVPRETLDSLLSFNRDRLADLNSTMDVTLYVTEESPPYALWIMDCDEDDVAGLTVYENGGVQGVLMNDSPDAVAWVRREYEKYRSNATERRLATLDSGRAN